MFGKLLKYDFRSMLKQFAFIWPAALALAVINRFTLSGLESTSATGETVAAVAMMVFVAIMIAMFVITLIFVIQRFYKGLLGDEGYLMHTLPVRPWALIGSKLVCAVVLTVVSTLVAVAAILIIVSPVIDLGEFFHVIRWLWDAVCGGKNAANAFLACVELLLLILLGMAEGYLMLYLATRRHERGGLYRHPCRGERPAELYPQRLWRHAVQFLRQPVLGETRLPVAGGPHVPVDLHPRRSRWQRGVLPPDGVHPAQ